MEPYIYRHLDFNRFPDAVDDILAKPPSIFASHVRSALCPWNHASSCPIPLLSLCSELQYVLLWCKVPPFVLPPGAFRKVTRMGFMEEGQMRCFLQLCESLPSVTHVDFGFVLPSSHVLETFPSLTHVLIKIDHRLPDTDSAEGISRVYASIGLRLSLCILAEAWECPDAFTIENLILCRLADQDKSIFRRTTVVMEAENAIVDFREMVAGRECRWTRGERLLKELAGR